MSFLFCPECVMVLQSVLYMLRIPFLAKPTLQTILFGKHHFEVVKPPYSISLIKKHLPSPRKKAHEEKQMLSFSLSCSLVSFIQFFSLLFSAGAALEKGSFAAESAGFSVR